MKRKLFALAFAAGCAGLALTAWAQAPGHGMRDPLAMLERMQSKLNLNTSQQQQWDAAVAQSKVARDAMRANFQQLKDATKAELAKADPDLGSLASLSDQVQQQNIDQRKKARAAWLFLDPAHPPPPALSAMASSISSPSGLGSRPSARTDARASATASRRSAAANSDR